MRKSAGPKLRFRHLALAALPLVALQSQKNVPMKDVDIRGRAVAPTREVRIVLEAGIGTIFGRVPIRGNTLLTYDCSSAFKGRVSYSAWVRFFAKLKGVDLLTDIDGTVAVAERPECPVVSADVIVGYASVDTSQLSGWVKLDRDSLSFAGPAWVMGDSSYHATLTTSLRGKQVELRVNMYER
jgi:hypothetical protein